MKLETHRSKLFACLGSLLLLGGSGTAETCVTQSQMQPVERAALVDAAQSLSLKLKANDQAGIRTATIPEFTNNFSGIASSVTSTAPKITNDTPEIEQVYILDATSNKANSDGSMPEADFVCTLNKGSGEADFNIPALPPGRYGFVIVQFTGSSPWMVSMLLRQDADGGAWKLAGLFPKESSAAGHDGLWYWGQGRASSAAKQPFVAYIYYQQAQQLLRPAPFVSSTHLESLRAESSQAVQPEIGDEVSRDTPLIVKSAGGVEYRFVALGPDDSLHKEKLDVVARLLLDPSVTDQAAATKLSREATLALLTQHPELRPNFHGVWVFAEASGRTVATVESPMEEIR